MPLPYIQRPIGGRTLFGVFVVVFHTIKIKPVKTESYKNARLNGKRETIQEAMGQNPLEKEDERKKERNRK